MRGSWLYPSQKRSAMLGVLVCALSVCLLVVLAARMTRNEGATPPEKVRCTLSGLEGVSIEKGPVFLLDEPHGRITIVGDFSVTDRGASMSLRLPGQSQEARMPVKAYFWPETLANYAPYGKFLFDDAMQKRMNKVLTNAWGDPVVQVGMKDIGMKAVNVLEDTVKPEIGNALSKAIVVSINARKTAPFGDTFTSNINWAGWISNVNADPEFQEAFKALGPRLEPHLIGALKQLLWYAPPGGAEVPVNTPNARLLWVARRVIFGGRERPAILLIATPADGVVLENDAVLMCEIVQ